MYAESSPIEYTLLSRPNGPWIFKWLGTRCASSTKRAYWGSWDPYRRSNESIICKKLYRTSHLNRRYPTERGTIPRGVAIVCDAIVPLGETSTLDGILSRRQKWRSPQICTRLQSASGSRVHLAVKRLDSIGAAPRDQASGVEGASSEQVG